MLLPHKATSLVMVFAAAAFSTKRPLVVPCVGDGVVKWHVGMVFLSKSGTRSTSSALLVLSHRKSDDKSNFSVSICAKHFYFCAKLLMSPFFRWCTGE